MSGSFESVQWNACVHRLDLDLNSNQKEFLGNGVRTHFNSKGKIPSTGNSGKDRTRNTASCRTASPTYYRLSFSCPPDKWLSTWPCGGKVMVSVKDAWMNK